MLRGVKEAPDRWPALTGFALGIFVGILLVAVMGWSAARSVQRRGVTVKVQVAPLAAQVEAEVRAAVRKEVPAALDAMRTELPGRVADATARQMAGMTVNVAGFNVPVPDGAAQQLRGGVEAAVRSGLKVAVTDADINVLADRLAAQAGGMVRTKLVDYLRGRTFPVEVWRGFAIPVTVVPE